jgi:protocatechuate 3,4-dioxygenase beta subunit
MAEDSAGSEWVLSRREVLALLGAAGTGAFLVAPGRGHAQIPSFVVAPKLDEDPYFVDEKLNRSDIRSDPADKTLRPGWPLRLTLRVSQLTAAGACAPLGGAIVDLWQCDASGRYSDVLDQNDRFDTRGQKFLRGHQVTNNRGIVRFTTIFPGWYPGRAVHVHLKVRTSPSARGGANFSTQLYFEDALIDRVHAKAPYAIHGRRDTPNDQDEVFVSGGQQQIVRVTEGATALSGSFELAIKRA